MLRKKGYYTANHEFYALNLIILKVTYFAFKRPKVVVCNFFVVRNSFNDVRKWLKKIEKKIEKKIFFKKKHFSRKKFLIFEIIIFELSVV